MGNCCKLIQNPHKNQTNNRSEDKYYHSSSTTASGTTTAAVVTTKNGDVIHSGSSKTNKNISSHALHTQQQQQDKRSDDGNSTFVPHIADFYPDDTTTIPTDNARASTMFLLKADAKKKLNENSSYNASESNLQLSKRFNSCSTIYVDNSTVSQPNLKNEIKLVACAIHLHIKRRTSDRNMDIFDEKLHPLFNESVPLNYYKIVPEQRHIYRFMKNLFTAAQLTAECAIVTLIYLERVLTYAEIDLCPANWKRLLLGAILLASKVWDDQAVWNVDYCQILTNVNVEDMNELERQYLGLLQFNINVPSSVYAKYYFDLRTLAEDNNIQQVSELLTVERAIKLEALSSMCQEKNKDRVKMLKANLRRTHSADTLVTPSRKSIVIIS